MGRSRFMFWYWRQWYHGHSTLHTGPMEETTTRLLAAGLLDAWWTCLVHLADGITAGAYWLLKRQRSHWAEWDKGMGTSSLWWDLPHATSAHPATSTGQTPAAPAPLWPPGLCLCRCGCFFCVVSCQHTHFEWKPAHQYIWERHVYSQMHNKPKLSLVEKDRGLPWSSWNTRWDESWKLPTTEQSLHCNAVTLWLCPYTGAK